MLYSLPRDLAVQALNADVEIFMLVDRRMKARTMTRGEWRAYSRWLRLRRREWAGNHRRRETAQARSSVVWVVTAAIACQSTQMMRRPFEEIGRSFAAANASFQRFARVWEPATRSLGRRALYGMSARSRLERHFELGGGE